MNDRKYYIYIVTQIDYDGILFSLTKEGNPAVYNNMDEPGGHYTE